MKDKKTLFDYVFRDLCDQMKVGRLAYGDALPSMNQLCELYHVGIRTVKDVMRALKAAGYIRTEERKPAVVIYRQEGSQQSLAIQAALRQKTSILQMYETMSVILPPIIAQSAICCEQEEMERWAVKFRNFDHREPEKRKKLMASFLYSLLEGSGNLLFRDLYRSYELYARIPLFLNEKSFEERVVRHNEFHSLTWVAKALLERDGEKIVFRFSTMYQAIVYSIRILLEELSIEHPDVSEDAALGFSWDIQRGRDHLYLQIARDFIDKIGTGVYTKDSFLPPESVLAAEYGVCVTTIRSALSLLNEVGFAKTYNVKGTKVIWQEDEVAARCMGNKKFKRDTLLYLSALQMMAILIPYAAMLSGPEIGEEAKAELGRQLKDPSCIPMDAIVKCIIHHQALGPMKTILQELSGLAVWGYYYSFYKNGPGEEEIVASKSAEAYRYLCEGGMDELAQCLFSCYCHILDFIREFTIKCGLWEAKLILTPQFYRNSEGT